MHYVGMVPNLVSGLGSPKVWRNASLRLSEVSDQPNDQAEENKGVSASGDDTQRRG
jgi:hypothetical protein